MTVRHFAFRIAEVFPEDAPLSEWLVTLSVAMNDLALVHGMLEDDQDAPERAFYWNRLAISHFAEAGLFLSDTREVEEVQTYLGSLGDEARANYETTLAVFDEVRGRLFSVRNKATFHYPGLRPTNPQADRPVRDALRLLAEDSGVIRSARIKDARALFADDVMAAIFGDELGGLDRIPDFEGRVAQGTTAFIRFANLALDEHLVRAREQGAAIRAVDPIDPADPAAGWKESPSAQ